MNSASQKYQKHQNHEKEIERTLNDMKNKKFKNIQDNKKIQRLEKKIAEFQDKKSEILDQFEQNDRLADSRVEISEPFTLYYNNLINSLKKSHIKKQSHLNGQSDQLNRTQETHKIQFEKEMHNIFNILTGKNLQLYYADNAYSSGGFLETKTKKLSKAMKPNYQSFFLNRTEVGQTDRNLYLKNKISLVKHITDVTKLQEDILQQKLANQEADQVTLKKRITMLDTTENVIEKNFQGIKTSQVGHQLQNALQSQKLSLEEKAFKNNCITKDAILNDKLSRKNECELLSQNMLHAQTQLTLNQESKKDERDQIKDNKFKLFAEDVNDERLVVIQDNVRILGIHLENTLKFIEDSKKISSVQEIDYHKPFYKEKDYRDYGENKFFARVFGTKKTSELVDDNQVFLLMNKNKTGDQEEYQTRLAMITGEIIKHFKTLRTDHYSLINRFDHQQEQKSKKTILLESLLKTSQNRKEKLRDKNHLEFSSEGTFHPRKISKLNVFERGQGRQSVNVIGSGVAQKKPSDVLMNRSSVGANKKSSLLSNQSNFSIHDSTMIDKDFKYDDDIKKPNEIKDFNNRLNPTTEILKSQESFQSKTFLSILCMHMKFCTQLAYIEDNAESVNLPLHQPSYIKTFTQNVMTFLTRSLYNEDNIHSFINSHSIDNLDLFGEEYEGLAHLQVFNGTAGVYKDMTGQRTNEICNIRNVFKEIFGGLVSDEDESVWNWFIINFRIIGHVFEYEEVKDRIKAYRRQGLTEVDKISKGVMIDAYELYTNNIRKILKLAKDHYTVIYKQSNHQKILGHGITPAHESKTYQKLFQKDKEDHDDDLNLNYQPKLDINYPPNFWENYNLKQQEFYKPVDGENIDLENDNRYAEEFENLKYGSQANNELLGGIGFVIAKKSAGVKNQVELISDISKFKRLRDINLTHLYTQKANLGKYPNNSVHIDSEYKDTWLLNQIEKEFIGKEIETTNVTSSSNLERKNQDVQEKSLKLFESLNNCEFYDNEYVAGKTRDYTDKASLIKSLYKSDQQPIMIDYNSSEKSTKKYFQVFIEEAKKNNNMKNQVSGQNYDLLSQKDNPGSELEMSKKRLSEDPSISVEAPKKNQSLVLVSTLCKKLDSQSPLLNKDGLSKSFGRSDTMPKLDDNEIIDKDLSPKRMILSKQANYTSDITKIDKQMKYDEKKSSVKGKSQYASTTGKSFYKPKRKHQLVCHSFKKTPEANDNLYIKKYYNSKGRQYNADKDSMPEAKLCLSATQKPKGNNEQQFRVRTAGMSVDYSSGTGAWYVGPSSAVKGHSKKHRKNVSLGNLWPTKDLLRTVTQPTRLKKQDEFQKFEFFSLKADQFR